MGVTRAGVVVMMMPAILLLFPFYNAHQAFEKKEYDKAQDILQTAQVEKPNDPLLNYNLGTVHYKQKNWQAAQENFSRAASGAFSKNDNDLLEKSHFNLGNSYYQNGRAMLPDDWEKNKPDQATTQKVISELQQAVATYNKILEKKKDHERAKTNKKTVETLLKKLMQQQQQQKQEQKKDEDKKDEQEQQKQEKKDEQKEKQPQEQKKEEQQQQNQKQAKNMEQRQLEALLAKLEQSQEELQKKLMKQKIDKDKKPENSYQKPW